MAAKMITVDSEHTGQRIDNFLFTRLKGIPKSRIYRCLRQGEVRVNKGRVKPEYRLQTHDIVRIPPLRGSEEKPMPANPPLWQSRELPASIMYEDEGLLIVNKPSGMAVHGGSGVNFGVIETLRNLRPKAKFLELIHRLDRDTSGCLLIAKKNSVLREIQELIRNHQVEKVYLTLVKGKWQGGERKVDLPLLKNQLQSGERFVKVSEQGKAALTVFQPLQRFKDSTLVRVILHTGRTHQIRVHAAAIGHPVIGDEKYGDKNSNKQFRQRGLKRLFLHAASLTFRLESRASLIAICALMDKELIDLLHFLD